jgi:murein DD-endopeptidase MepM/ murein hydrolase activator NlpD
MQPRILSLCARIAARHRRDPHRIAVIGLFVGAALVTAGLVGSKPVEARRITVPIEITLKTERQPSQGDQLGAADQRAARRGADDFQTTTVTISRGDNMSLVFARAGLSGADLQALLDVDLAAEALRDVFPGQTLRFTTDKAHRLVELRFAKSPTETTLFRKEGAGFRMLSELREPEVREAFRHAVVQSSLFEAGIDSGVSHATILELANVFGGVIDFALDPRNDGRRYSAYRFVDSSGRAGYFSTDGVSMRKAFLRAPLDFTRVTSNFNMRRMHPIARVVRPHRGVDYGAPTGTPVYSSGDGRVLESGFSRSNGNYVFVKHDGNIVTRYLHLHKRLVKKGQPVSQGQTIGTVGATGLATGPHLHYEFLVDGTHRNPRSILDRLPRARSLNGSELVSFKARTSGIDSQLAQFTKAWELAIASNDDR